MKAKSIFTGAAGTIRVFVAVCVIGVLGCGKEIEISESIDTTGIDIHARKGYSVVAHYFYGVGVFADLRYLRYLNQKEKAVRLELNDNDTIEKIEIDGILREYRCEDPDNAALCEKAKRKLEEWKAIMNWQEKIKRILGQKVDPLEHLD